MCLTWPLIEPYTLRMLAPHSFSPFLSPPDRGFTAAQFTATVTCSIAVALLVLAAFRPAVAGCASVKSLGTAGGMLLITYAIIQLGAAVLAFFLEREFEDIGEYNANIVHLAALNVPCSQTNLFSTA